MEDDLHYNDQHTRNPYKSAWNMASCTYHIAGACQAYMVFFIWAPPDVISTPGT